MFKMLGVERFDGGEGCGEKILEIRVVEEGAEEGEEEKRLEKCAGAQAGDLEGHPLARCVELGQHFDAGHEGSERQEKVRALKEMVEIVAEKLADLEVFFFEKFIHVRRIVVDGVKKKEGEEKKGKYFKKLFEKILLPDFHSIPRSTFLMARSEKKRMIGSGAK